MIPKIRKKLPRNLRLALKVLTAKIPILTSLIALLYGYLLIPKSRKEAILLSLKSKTPKLFVIPDIYAVDCFEDIFIKNIYDKYKLINHGNIVIDIGAHVGMFTVKAARKVGNSGLVIAIEPEKENLKLLEKNVKSLKLENVKIIPKAVGAFKGFTELVVSELSGTHKLALYPNPENPKYKITVPIDTLDNIIQELGIKRIDFIKIDAEGAELDILKGARNALKFADYLAIAAYHAPNEANEIKEFLENYDFKVVINDGILYAFKVRE